MNSIIFKVNLQEETLSILFNTIHSYTRFGKSYTTVLASESFIQDVISIWEEYIPKLKLNRSDKLWEKSLKNNHYTYHNLKVRFSVFDNDISNQRYVSRVVNNFMCFLKTRLKRDCILVNRELNKITYVI